MRSGLTQKVRFDKGEKVIRDKTFWEELSGQMPDLGSDAPGVMPASPAICGSSSPMAAQGLW
jgi:hypothetical protein